MPLTYRLPLRLIQLLAGLIGYALSISLMVRAGLGNQPWDVFHQGVAIKTGLSIGTILVITGAAVLMCWIPLRQRPGIGTISNILVIGVVVDLVNLALPAPSSLAVRWLFLIGGIVLCGAASGLYIGANLGPGPRDGLMTGLAARSWSIRGWRTVIEIAVVLAGALLGGRVGIGTILYALSIGPLAQYFLPLFTVRPAPSPALAPASPSPASPALAPASPSLASLTAPHAPNSPPAATSLGTPSPATSP